MPESQGLHEQNACCGGLLYWGAVPRLASVLRGADAARRRFARLLKRRPYEVVPYLSYGTRERLLVRGRVLEAKGIGLPSPEATRWRNLQSTIKRFFSDEVPHAVLDLSCDGLHERVTADIKGYYQTWLQLPAAVAGDGWVKVQVALVSPSRPGFPQPRATAYVLVPAAEARFGVISDIDDTVIQMDVTRWVRMLTTVLFGNAYTRLPFKGVAAFYQALADAANPLFYVSSSPWNLYDLIVTFLMIEDIPLGPLCLRSWRSAEGGVVLRGHHDHKLAEISAILDTYPALPFVLVGDSGQEDPEIYREVVRRYPGRILVSYIRNVSRDPARVAAIAQLADTVRRMGSTLVLADDTLAAAQHAAAEGLIAEEALVAIGARAARDEALFARSPGRRQPTVIKR